MTPLVAPFPYFGGKRRVAAEVWRRFGNVRSYVEPFFGSGAVLLARPQPFSGVETVNDLDGLLCNFWRAVKADPAAVAEAADWPVSECDLTARHLWLVERRASITERLCADPEWFDAKAAGWWVWSLSNEAIPRGLHTESAYPGIANGPARKGSQALRDRGVLALTLRVIADRFANVVVRCGTWERALQSPSMRLANGGVEGVFLDPPYAVGDSSYATGADLAAEVRAWALKAGERHDMRIALCGYDEHDEMAAAGWRSHRWKAAGGYGSKGDGEARINSTRETVWFSPACIGAAQPSLFDMGAA